MDVLILCSGNICRSPMAAALLRAHLAPLGDAARVHSAGFLTSDEPASRHGVDLLAARNIDLSDHRSRLMQREMLEAADLIIGMARVHVREAVVMAPQVFPKAFTLKEIVRRGNEVGGRFPGQPLGEWLSKLHAGRDPASLMGDSPDDDIDDPIGRGIDAYQRTLAELDVLVPRLVHLAFAPDLVTS